MSKETSSSARIRRFFRYLALAFSLAREASPRGLALLVFLSLLGAAIPLTQAYFAKLVIDGVVASLAGGAGLEQGMHRVLPPLLAELALAVLASLTAQIRRLATDLLSQRLAHSVSTRLMDKSSRLELKCFEDSQFYDRLQKARRETEFRALAILNNSLLLLQNALTFLSFVLPVVYLSPWVALVLFASSLPAFVAQTYYGRLSFRLRSWQTPESRRLRYYEHVLTADTAAKEVRLFGLGPVMLRKHEETFAQMFGEDAALARRRSFASILFGALANLSFYACYAWTVVSVLRGLVTLGQLTFYLASFRQLQGTFFGIFENISSLFENGLFMQDLLLLLELPEREGGGPAAPVAGEGLEFRNVSFRYPGREDWAIKDVSFHLRPGQTLAIVGENGSGKTTLIKLLTRLYRPTSGQICFHGQDIFEIREGDFYRQVSAIFQDFTRYQTTLGENVSFGAPEAGQDTERLEQALAFGRATELVRSLPDGLSTVLGGWFEKGRELSGGQWQRIALARMAMREAELLVLDEPTAALDSVSEHEIIGQLNSFLRGKMAVLTSHRFGAVRTADLILVLEKGGLREAGTHDELMARAGIYAEMFLVQAESFR